MRLHKITWDAMCAQAAAGMGMMGGLGIGREDIGRADFSMSFLDND